MRKGIMATLKENATIASVGIAGVMFFIGGQISNAFLSSLPTILVGILSPIFLFGSVSIALISGISAYIWLSGILSKLPTVVKILVGGILIGLSLTGIAVTAGVSLIIAPVGLVFLKDGFGIK